MNELDLFMVDPDINLESLHKYPWIKALFLRFNTALPPSAPVERLFSAGPLILTARRNRLSDEFFETLLILKIHKSVSFDLYLFQYFLRFSFLLFHEYGFR